MRRAPLRARLPALLPTLLLAAFALSACGEKPQTATSRKADGKAWDTKHRSFDAAGWKGGDEAAWDLQLRNRAQGQNEYSRAVVR